MNRPKLGSPTVGGLDQITFNCGNRYSSVSATICGNKPKSRHSRVISHVARGKRCAEWWFVLSYFEEPFCSRYLKFPDRCYNELAATLASKCVVNACADTRMSKHEKSRSVKVLTVQSRRCGTRLPPSQAADN